MDSGDDRHCDATPIGKLIEEEKINKHKEEIREKDDRRRKQEKKKNGEEGNFTTSHQISLFNYQLKINYNAN